MLVVQSTRINGNAVSQSRGWLSGCVNANAIIGGEGQVDEFFMQRHYIIKNRNKMASLNSLCFANFEFSLQSMKLISHITTNSPLKVVTCLYNHNIQQNVHVLQYTNHNKHCMGTQITLSFFVNIVIFVNTISFCKHSYFCKYWYFLNICYICIKYCHFSYYNC